MSAYDHGYFESLYANQVDPWDFASSAYESTKYEATLAALPRQRYICALELGCSIGVLTERLASRAQHIVGVDTSGHALARARERLVAQTRINLVQAHLPEGDWERPYDLIVLSEVLYYLDATALAALTARLQRCALPGADIVAVHWTGDTDYPQSADQAMEVFEGAFPALTPLRRDRQPRYRLDVWRVSASQA